MRVLALVVLFPAVACAQSDSAHVRSQMGEHYIDAVAMRDGIISGDLPAVKAAVARLQARLPLEDLPPTAADKEPAFIDALLAVERSVDTTTAGEAVGDLVGACAGCHTHVGAKPAPPVPPAPAGGDGSIAAAMALHRHGAELMWVGLVVPDPGQVQRGAEVLASSVLTPTGTPVGTVLPPLAAELEVRVHDLAAHAARTDDPLERANAYGRMLGTCAACHAVTHGGPAP